MPTIADSTTAQPPSFTGDELAHIVDSPDFQSAPLEVRREFIQSALPLAFQTEQQTSEWTPERRRGWGEFASYVQSKAQPTTGEQIGQFVQDFGQAAVGVVKGIPGMVADTALALGSKLLGGGTDNAYADEQRRRGETPDTNSLAGAFDEAAQAQTAKTLGLVQRATGLLTQEEEGRRLGLAALREQIDAGEVPLNDAQAFSQWKAQWAKDLPFLGGQEAQNALDQFLATRSPDAWQSLDREASSTAKDKSGEARLNAVMQSPAVQSLPPYLQEQFHYATDPLQIATMVVPVEGVLGKAAGNALRRVGTHALSGGALGTALYARDNPGASLTESVTRGGLPFAALSGAMTTLGEMKSAEREAPGSGSQPSPPSETTAPRPAGWDGSMVDVPIDPALRSDGMEGAKDGDFAKLDEQFAPPPVDAPKSAPVPPPADAQAGLSDLGTMEGDVFTGLQKRVPEQDSASVTEGSPTEAKSGSPASDVARDAGSTPAAGADSSGAPKLGRDGGYFERNLESRAWRLAAGMQWSPEIGDWVHPDRPGVPRGIVEADVANENPPKRSEVRAIYQRLLKEYEEPASSAVVPPVSHLVEGRFVKVPRRVPVYQGGEVVGGKTVQEGGRITKALPAGKFEVRLSNGGYAVFDGAEIADSAHSGNRSDVNPTVKESLTVDQSPAAGAVSPVVEMPALDPSEPSTFQAAREWADKTIKDKAGQLRTGFDPELIAAYAIKAVGSGVDFATYVAGVVKEFGEGAREMARDAWVRVHATMRNDPQDASRAKPLNDALGGAPQDYTAWKAEDMQARAGGISAAYSTPELVRALSSDQGLQRMGVDPSLREFMNAEALRRALADVGSATNDVDRIRAQSVLRQARSIYDVSGTEAGQHLASRALAAKDLRAEAPDLAMTEAIEKEQSKVIDPALPVDAAADEAGKAAGEAGTRATDAIATALSDEEFEARLQPVLKGLMPMRGPEIEGAVRALTETGETWRDVAIREAEQAVEQQFTRNQLDPAGKGALRTLIDNMKSILKSKVPRTGVKAPLKSIAEGVARVFLDYQNERALFETAWKSAREKLLDKVAEEHGNPVLATELGSVLPASPHLWFSPQAASELFTRALAKLQGLDKPRLADVVLNSDRVGNGVLKLLTQEALDAGMDTVREPAVQRQMLEAWKDWVDQAKGRAMVAERMRIETTRGKLLAGDSPLRKLVNDLRAKITGGLSWREVFTSSATSQREWELQTYASIRKHEALKDLSHEEAVKLTREASKVWQTERRRVWQAELEKSQLRAGVKPRPLAKVKAASERLLKLINLGALDASSFRDALAKEFGIKDLSAPEIKQVRELAVKYQAAPDGVARRRLGQQIIERMQDVTRLSKAELLESYWTTAVLSGWRTMVDIGLAVANGIEDVGFGGIVTALRTGNADVALRGVANVIGNLPRALNEAWHIAVTGDKSIMRNYQRVIDDALSDGGRDFASAARQLREKGGLVGKPAGLFMEGMARILTVLDHINQSSTAAGAKWLAMAEHPDLYRKALEVTARDRALARERALNELTGGAEPKTNAERVQVKARVEEIIDEMVPTEIIAEAMTIGEDAAMQGDPTGLGGIAVDLVRKVIGAPDSWVKALETGPKANHLGTRELVFALKMASTFGRVLTGTKFVRVVGHQINRSLSYVPGIGLARFKEGSMNGVKADVLIAKQLVGLTAGLAVLNWFRSGGKDSDEKRGIEGNWKNLNPNQRSQLYAQGKQPNTIWYRDTKGRVVSINFQQWGLSGMFAALGAMEDQRRYHGHNKTDATVLLNGLAGGLFAWRDKAQLQGLQTILGESPYASDNIGEDFVKRLNKWASMTVGGLVPRVLKDIDLVASPTLRDSSEWWSQWAGQVPMLRELSTGARVDIFGNDIKQDRGPMSRVWLRGNEGKPYQLLGLLNERDVWLPDPSAAQRVVKTQAGRRPLAREERDRYQRLTGAAYADYIERNGENFVNFIERGGPPEKRNDRVMKIRAMISKQTKPLRDRAAQAAVR